MRSTYGRRTAKQRTRSVYVGLRYRKNNARRASACFGRFPD